MITIPLQSIPNQTLSIVLDGNQYNITLKSCEGITAIDLVRNNVTILSGHRVVAGFPLIPYEYWKQEILLFQHSMTIYHFILNSAFLNF